MPYTVDFEPIGRRGLCGEGGTLLDAARDLGVDLASVCGGVGTCGRCKVQIIEGDVTPPDAAERNSLSERELREGYRLACRAAPLSDVKMHVPAESLTALQRTQIEGRDVPVEVKPSVVQCIVRIDPPTLEDLRGDDQRLCEAVAGVTGIRAVLTDLAVARCASATLRNNGWTARVTVAGRDIIHVAPVDAPWLGLAVDIGTTKMAGYVLDLNTGQTLAARGVMNPQIAYGEDVVARLIYAGRGDDEAARLQALLVAGLSQLAADACGEIGACATDIVEAVVVANTAIHHLFLRLPTRQLATAPYVPAMRAAVNITAREIGLQLAPGAQVHLLPNIAGYVGADHVAMLLASDVLNTGRVTAAAKGEIGQKILAIDIGTNTEMCLIAHGKMTSLSCASGPAFEGAHVKFGMRAAPGAIERVRIVDGRVEYKTIDDQPAVGICGSGIVDVVAHLLLAGNLDRRGRLSGPGVRETELAGGNDHAPGRDLEFVITPKSESGNERAITVTQHDIRELQLAKGAIRSGIETLLTDAGLAATELDQVIIAGAFGSYIDIESALAIGLLPDIPAERIVQVGNAAGAGARLALISRPMRRQAEEIARRVRYLELARAPGFMRSFAEGMLLGRNR